MEMIQAARPPGRQAANAGKFGKIGVLMGGPSTEREISLKSGKAVYESLMQFGIEAAAIDIKTDNVEENKRLIQSCGINCAFLALHGRFGEDGQIQLILEELKISYTGSGVEASRLAMDKIASRLIFEKCGLNVPKYKEIRRHQLSAVNEAVCAFNFPLVIKPVAHGSSVGLTLVDSENGLAEAIDLAFSFDERALIEEYIMGREFTVGILNNEALPVIEIVPKNRFFDYEAKYHPGMTEYIVPALLDERIANQLKQKALVAHRALGCFGCSRVDIILRNDFSPFILEVNTIPGFTETSLLPKAAKAGGLDFVHLCVRLIELAYEKAQAKSTF